LKEKVDMIPRRCHNAPVLEFTAAITLDANAYSKVIGGIRRLLARKFDLN